MYNDFNNSPPSYMCDVSRTRHHYSIQQSTATHIVPHIKGRGSKSFTFNGIKLWDEHLCEVQSIQQNHPFQCKILKNVRIF